MNIYLSQLVRVRGKYTFLSFSDFQTLDPWFPPKYVTASTTEICQNMSLYPLLLWDIKYVTVSNTWAIKDTVTSYFTKYTLCSVNTPKIYLIYILAYIVISRKKSQKPQKRIKITDFTIFTVWLLSSKSCKRGSWNRNLLNYFEKVWHI